MSATLATIFAESVRRHAARPAVCEEGGAVTYEELGARVASRSASFLEAGLAPGAALAIFYANGLDFVVNYFAAVVGGLRVVPLNEQYGDDDLLHFLTAGRAEGLAVEEGNAERCRTVLARYSSGCRLFSGGADAGAGSVALDGVMHEADPESPAMVQFSSGSTGTPKRIARSHACIVGELEALRLALGVTPEDRFLGVAPFSHVNGMVRTMLNAMAAGAALYPVASFGRQSVARLIESERLTIFIAVPFMFSMLAEARFRSIPDFSSLRYCISASAPMPVNVNRLFAERYGRSVRQLYGSTETGSISAHLESDLADALDSVGRPLPGVEMRVMRDDGSEAGADESGELLVRSPYMIGAYEDLPDATRESFREGWYYTGDVGRRDAEGRYYLLGRKKFFINKGGYKIDPVQLERLLEEHPAVREAVVVGVPAAYGDERVKAYVVPGDACTAEELVEHCRGRIAAFKIPSLFEFREELPKSPTGKIRRRLLMESG